jgi:hypothetical protein
MKTETQHVDGYDKQGRIINAHLLEILVERDRLQQVNAELVVALKELMTHYVGERSSENVVGPAGIAADKARKVLEVHK